MDVSIKENAPTAASIAAMPLLLSCCKLTPAPNPQCLIRLGLTAPSVLMPGIKARAAQDFSSGLRA